MSAAVAIGELLVSISICIALVVMILCVLTRNHRPPARPQRRAR